MKIIVYHEFYGCDTGCCGHIIETDNKKEFMFAHPHGGDFRQFAENLIAEKYGAEHVSNIDWEHCSVLDD